ncbi:MAG: hypothetical protein M1831_002846 [Alyxoria varia]|nr:MAG: hypothetical protein M1831_002846 [Alyxoria varia]
MKPLLSMSTPNRPSDVRFQSWRVDANAGNAQHLGTAPQLALREVSPLTMAENNPPSTGNSRISATPRSPYAGTPTSDVQLEQRSISQTSAPFPPLAQRVSSFQSSLLAPGRNSPPPSDSATSEGWSSAVGRPALGQTGRHIERQQTEIDRLKRELNAETSFRQELERRHDLSSTRIQQLETENTSLKQESETYNGIIKRKDRKLAELKSEKETEQIGRKEAESQIQAAHGERDQALTDYRRQVSEAKEREKHATLHAEILEQSHKQLAREYRTKVPGIREELEKARRGREEELERVKRLEIVIEQQKQELNKQAMTLGVAGEQLGKYGATTSNAKVAVDGQAEEIQKMEEELTEVRFWLRHGRAVAGAQHPH